MLRRICESEEVGILQTELTKEANLDPRYGHYHINFLGQMDLMSGRTCAFSYAHVLDMHTAAVFSDFVKCPTVRGNYATRLGEACGSYHGATRDGVGRSNGTRSANESKASFVDDKTLVHCCAGENEEDGTRVGLSCSLTSRRHRAAARFALTGGLGMALGLVWWGLWPAEGAGAQTESLIRAASDLLLESPLGMMSLFELRTRLVGLHGAFLFGLTLLPSPLSSPLSLFLLLVA